MLIAPRPRAHRTRTSSRSGSLSRTLLTTVAVTLSLSLSLSTPEATAAPSPTERPVDYSQAAAARYALTHNDQPPPGANDWGCRPTPQHPRPVILVHGSLANMAINWYSLAPLLKNHGYCVFALNYGQDPAHPIGTPARSRRGRLRRWPSPPANSPHSSIESKSPPAPRRSISSATPRADSCPAGI